MERFFGYELLRLFERWVLVLLKPFLSHVGITCWNKNPFATDYIFFIMCEN